jgi:Domain of unknown function (DUF4386)
MNTPHRTAARVFGIFFLLSFVSYAVGNGLIESLLTVPESLASISAHKVQMISGAVLIVLFHTLFNTGLAVAMHSVLQPQSKPLANAYLSAALVSTILLAFGAVFLLLLLPLSEEFVKAGAPSGSYFQALSLLCQKGNFFAYQIGMAIWGMGGLVLCFLLYQSLIVPRFLSIWGFLGYMIFIAGTLAELFGNAVGVMLSIPGGLFEIALSVWLIVKGFKTSSTIAGQ